MQAIQAQGTQHIQHSRTWQRREHLIRHASMLKHQEQQLFAAVTRLLYRGSLNSSSS
jgi:hypothetical protein